MRVVVLLGGESEERDVSLASGCQVADALRQAGHEVVAFDPVGGALAPSDEARILTDGVGSLPPGEVSGGGASGADDSSASTGALRSAAFSTQDEVVSADVVLSVLHGGKGEDGTIQALLELGGLVYAGSGVLGCGLAMDKDVTKRLLRDAGIATPDWLVDPTAEQVVDRLGLPVIAKPVAGGSSVRLYLLRDAAGVEETIGIESARASRSGEVPDMMFEAYIAGREFTVGILGGEALPVGEIVSDHELFDYECKYQAGMADEVFPAEIPDELASAMQKTALEVHELLRLRDFSRVDFMVDEGGKAWCLEANALPGMTANSLLPKAARAAGIPFPELCDRIVRMAAERTRSASS